MFLPTQYPGFEQYLESLQGLWGPLHMWKQRYGFKPHPQCGGSSNLERMCQQYTTSDIGLITNDYYLLILSIIFARTYSSPFLSPSLFGQEIYYVTGVTYKRTVLFRKSLVIRSTVAFGILAGVFQKAGKVFTTLVNF